LWSALSFMKGGRTWSWVLDVLVGFNWLKFSLLCSSQPLQFHEPIN
jgi:hypothetical protein